MAGQRSPVRMSAFGHGWAWDVTTASGAVITARTDRDGVGLWVLAPTDERRREWAYRAVDPAMLWPHRSRSAMRAAVLRYYGMSRATGS